VKPTHRADRRSPTGAGSCAEPGTPGTNVQVEGVDEPDIVKTDSKRIVSIVEGKLRLASAETSAVSTRSHCQKACTARSSSGRRPHPVVGTTGYAQVGWEDIASGAATAATPD
jgi:hypothetical protein